MKTKLILALTSLLFFSCENNEVSPAATLPNEIIGNWLLVSEEQKMNNTVINDDNGLISYWGGTGVSWVGNIELNENKTISINHYGLDRPTNGTWKLADKTITFHTEIDYVGTVLRDTFKFEVAVEGRRLVLENDKLLLKHKKLN